MEMRILYILFVCLNCHTGAWFVMWACRYVSWQRNYFGEMLANEFAIINEGANEKPGILMSSDDSCLKDVKTHVYRPAVSLYTETGAVIRLNDRGEDICYYMNVKQCGEYGCYELAGDNIDKIEDSKNRKIESDSTSIAKFRKGNQIKLRNPQYRVLCDRLKTYKMDTLNETSSESVNESSTWLNTLVGQIEIFSEK